ncbi:SDR family oxidoreductase [Taibaiella koreensis]|uniref:SDR family oxidoreductase n=1 Tax=Taibaiella koreensis TaxID=1268548 RepID=UPI000E59A8A7|nr:NAD(P)H-binding protein [Taibaiella koreensis]
MEATATARQANGRIKTAKEKHPVLVIGGNGKTGRKVMQHLEAMDWPVKNASRSGDIRFDWHDTRTWAAALQGMQSVYITYQPDLAVPGATEAIGYLVTTAAQAGVKKLVLLSGRGEQEAQECEQIIMGSGLDWTIVRASWFCQNFSEGSFYEPIMAGHVALPAGNVGEPFIDADDIAAVAVAAITETGHDGEIYEVTGPRLLTFREAVATIEEATGRPIHYQRITMEAYAAELAAYALPEDLIWLITYLFTEVLDGRNEKICDGVERALGRKATDFADFARKAAAEGAWADERLH